MIENEKQALDILMEKGDKGSTVSELSCRLDISRSGTLDLVKRLMAKKYVRGEQQTDQKVWRFWITLKGEIALAENDIKNDLQMDMGFDDFEDWDIELL